MAKTLVFEMAMTCNGCANTARKVLAKLGEDNVKVVEIDVATKKITVISELPAGDVKKALEKTGKKVSLLEEHA